jgi:hypothetical protein
MKRSVALAAIILFLTAAGSAQTAGRAGAFARIGFGARGMGMGNAMTAVVSGEISSYYNPALPAFSEARYAAGSFGFLSLDRSLNFLSYTMPIHPTGGLSAGLINAGVSDIDGRDADGARTQSYSTYENQVYLAFSNRVDKNVSIGVAIKLYHSKLFEGVTTTTVGFDAGILVRPADGLAVGAALLDIGSKYKWNTKDVNSSGKETEDKFPMLKRLGVSYTFAEPAIVAAVDIEHASGGSPIFRGGVEYAIVREFTVRAGADRMDFGDDATGVKPTFGFSVNKALEGWTPSLSYVYTHESFAPRGFHMITLSAIF